MVVVQGRCCYSRLVRKTVAMVAVCAACVLVVLTRHLPLPTSLTPEPSSLPAQLLLYTGELTVREAGKGENGRLKHISRGKGRLVADGYSDGENKIDVIIPETKSSSSITSANSSVNYAIANSKSLSTPGNKSIGDQKLKSSNITTDDDITAKINTLSIGIASNINTTSDNTSQRNPRREVLMDWRRRWVRPWGSDPACSQYQIGFAALGALRPCALASYPGSGNTWTRQLLQAATGVFTGSTYRDQQLFMSGYLGELEAWDSGTTFTQKTHECARGTIKGFNGTGILLLRNPYRAIIAYHNYLFGGHTGFASVSNYRRKDWGAFVHLQTRAWLELAVNWTRHGRAIQVLHYEYLRTDPAPHLAAALTFTGITPHPHRLACLLKHESPGFKRRPEYIPKDLAVFSETDRDKVDRAVRYVDYLLRQDDHTPLPLHLYDFYNHTHSQMLEVQCGPKETTAQCDERVDRLNHVRNRVKASQGVGNNVTGPARDTLATRVTAPGWKEKLDPLKRFVSTKVGWFMTKAFTSIMKSGFTDPISRIVGKPGQS